MSLSALLFDNSGRATEALRQVLEITATPNDGTARGIRDVTQRMWYQAGKLRAEIDEQHGHLLDALMPHFRVLGMVDAVLPPPAGKYEYCLLLGGTIVAVRRRLKFQQDQSRDLNVFCQKIVFLGSNRRLLDHEFINLHNSHNPDCPFDPRNAAPADQPLQTEGDMMRMVAQQVFGMMFEPRGVSMCVAPDVLGRSAKTFDSVFYWHRNVAQKPGSVIAVSSQPFICLQDQVCRSVLGDAFPVTTIGYAANSDTKVSVYLDNLAKWIYEIMLTSSW